MISLPFYVTWNCMQWWGQTTKRRGHLCFLWFPKYLGDDSTMLEPSRKPGILHFCSELSMCLFSDRNLFSRHDKMLKKILLSVHSKEILLNWSISREFFFLWGAIHPQQISTGLKLFLFAISPLKSSKKAEGDSERL